MSVRTLALRLSCDHFSRLFSIRLTPAVFSEHQTHMRNDNPLTLSCRWSRIIRKRITRIPSDIEFTESEVLEDRRSENDCPPVKLINRNPRNLEQLQFEQKPLGFEMDTPSVSFWNKLVLQRSGYHLKASVLHHSGSCIVSVSNKEFTDQTSNSSTDINAIKNLGTILAKRCLESGILYVHIEMTAEELKTQKVHTFLNALRDNGLILKEPDFIFPRRKRDL